MQLVRRIEFGRDGVVEGIFDTGAARFADEGITNIGVQIPAPNPFTGDDERRVIGLTGADTVVVCSWNLYFGGDCQRRKVGGLVKDIDTSGLLPYRLCRWWTCRYQAE